MKTTYTPGPWRVGDAGRTVFGPPAGLPPVIVANCDYQQIRAGGSARANARLISLAPELVEALRRCKAAVENTALPPSARMELVRDFATPILARLEEGGPNCPCEMCKETRGDILL